VTEGQATKGPWSPFYHTHLFQEEEVQGQAGEKNPTKAELGLRGTAHRESNGLKQKMRKQKVLRYGH